MTNKEILKADLLDILFEHRNKAYGAYALRKNYNLRLQWSLGVSLSLLLLLLLVDNREGNLHVGTDVKPDVIIHAVEFTKVKQKETEPTRPRVEPPGRTPTSDQMMIVREEQTNVPDQNESSTGEASTQGDGNLAADDVASERNASSEKPTVEPNNARAEPERTFSSSDAQFPGGVESFRKFLTKNLLTPDDLQVDEKKTVVVRFKVDIDGSISNAQIQQSGGDKYDREVLRVLNKMPKWVPATQNGVEVATWFTQPVTFIGVE